MQDIREGLEFIRIHFCEVDDFMFELNDVEVENLSRCKNFTLNMGRGSNIKYKPYVFTEQGVYMLMTVLCGDLAIKQSRALVKTFKKMKDYILENRDLIGQREILQLSMETANDSSKDAGKLMISVLSAVAGIERENIRVQTIKRGKYGGTFAHKDIAFEFASAISPVFKLYLIKEFKRLKVSSVVIYTRVLSRNSAIFT